MEVALNEVKGQLSHFIRRVQAGEQIIITSHGKPVAELKSLGVVKNPIEKLTTINRILREASQTATDGADAEHSADFLYGDDGMPT